MSTGSFENLPNISGNLEGYMPAQGYADAQDRPEKALNSPLWPALRLCISRKGRQRHGALNTRTELRSMDCEARWYQVLKKLLSTY